jgi:putative transposase
MYDVTKAAAQEAIIDLGSAFRAFFEKRGRYPHFKRKDDRASFCAANEVGTFRTNGKRIKLPVIGWVKMREAVRFTGPLKRATVSCEAGRWFVALQIETYDVRPVTQPEAEVGIDLGVSALATLSTGEIIVGPKSHAVALKQLRRASRAFSRKRRGSANARKAKARLARVQRRIANIRRDATHKLTTRVTKTFAVIGIEDLDVRGMLRFGGLHARSRMVVFMSSGGRSTIRPDCMVPESSSPIVGQARPVLAAASSRRRWPWGKGRSAVTTVVSRSRVT